VAAAAAAVAAAAAATVAAAAAAAAVTHFCDHHLDNILLQGDAVVAAAAAAAAVAVRYVCEYLDDVLLQDDKAAAAVAAAAAAAAAKKGWYYSAISSCDSVSRWLLSQLWDIQDTFTLHHHLQSANSNSTMWLFCSLYIFAHHPPDICLAAVASRMLGSCVSSSNCHTQAERHNTAPRMQLYFGRLLL
jgi:hypothetical protein